VQKILINSIRVIEIMVYRLQIGRLFRFIICDFEIFIFLYVSYFLVVFLYLRHLIKIENHLNEVNQIQLKTIRIYLIIRICHKKGLFLQVNLQFNIRLLLKYILN
jgi:hypothetical protein